jgi:membrane protein implicated in regulation of membrane protease activity
MLSAAGNYFQSASPHLRMNADAIPGQRAIALTELVLGGGAGRVRLRAMEWLAEPVDDRIIPAGSHVRIIAINGTTLVVRAEEA